MPSKQSGNNGREQSILALELDGTFARASREAIRKQRSLGIPVTFKRGKKIIRKYPNGREQVLETLDHSSFQFTGNVPRIRKK